MAKEKKTAAPAPADVWLVNPAGALHQVPLEIARERLRTAGYRIATEEEVEELRAQGFNQRFDAPIATPFAETLGG